MKSGVRSDPSTWTDQRHRDGYTAERVAIEYLLARGWTVLAQRFRVGRHDIDIVARRAGVVVFFEVKLRATEVFGSPRQAVGYRKRRALCRAAAVWVERHGRSGEEYRFDFIGVGRGSIDHQPDAFRVPEKEGWR